MDNTLIKDGYMLIYVNTENYRDWSNSADVVWDTIPVEVEVGFSAIGKYYDPVSKTWIDDVIPEPTKEEIEADKALEVIGSLEFRLSEIKQDIIYNSVMGYDNSALTVEAREIEMMLEELNKGD